MEMGNDFGFRFSSASSPSSSGKGRPVRPPEARQRHHEQQQQQQQQLQAGPPGLVPRRRREVARVRGGGFQGVDSGAKRGEAGQGTLKKKSKVFV